MGDYDVFDDAAPPRSEDPVATGVHPGLIVLVAVVVPLLLFAVGHTLMWYYAQGKVVRPRKKVSKKKQKREMLRRGMPEPE